MSRLEDLCLAGASREEIIEAQSDEIESLRQQLAALKSELKTIGNAIDDPRTDLTMTMSEIIIEQKQQLAAAQARIDALMLEYCPDEMTKEQLVEWAKHQQIVVDTGGMMK